MKNKKVIALVMAVMMISLLGGCKSKEQKQAEAIGKELFGEKDYKEIKKELETGQVSQGSTTTSSNTSTSSAQKTSKDSNEDYLVNIGKKENPNVKSSITIEDKYKPGINTMAEFIEGATSWDYSKPDAGLILNPEIADPKYGKLYQEFYKSAGSVTSLHWVLKDYKSELAGIVKSNKVVRKGYTIDIKSIVPRTSGEPVFEVYFDLIINYQINGVEKQVSYGDLIERYRKAQGYGVYTKVEQKYIRGTIVSQGGGKHTVGDLMALVNSYDFNLSLFKDLLNGTIETAINKK